MVWRTTAITITTCFLLGTTFTHWIVDHNVLWRSPLTAEAVHDSASYYSLLAGAPTGLGWVYVAVGMISILSTAGRTAKAAKRDRGEILFDGASLVLLGSIAYNQITDVYPTISVFPSPLPAKLQDHALYPGLTTAVRDLANDNVITAVMLTGVMLLQAGRYYAKRSARSIPAVTEPPSADSSAPTSPPLQPIRRSGTPFRELTEEEALELKSLDESRD